MIIAVEAGTSVCPSSSPCLEELVKCSALRESHLTTIPQSWYQPQLLDPNQNSLYVNWLIKFNTTLQTTVWCVLFVFHFRDVSKYISQETFSTLEVCVVLSLIWLPLLYWLEGMQYALR